MQDIAKLEQIPLDNRLAGLRSTYELIQRTADRMAEKTALHFLLTGETDEQAIDISYARLFDRITRTANMFHDLGIRSGDVISSILPNLPETHYILWGAEAAGIANPINPFLAVDHMVSIMNAARSRLLVIEANLEISRHISQIKQRVPTLDHVIQVGSRENPAVGVLRYEDIIDRYDGDHLDSARQFHRDDVCSLFHTGGTTGTPKLARHSHYNEIANGMMIGLTVEMTSGDTGLCGLPLFHVNGAILTGLACFLQGATMVLATPGGFRTAEVMANFWQIIEKYRVTFFSGVPTIYTALLRIPVGEADVSSLRQAICGAAPMPRDIISKFEATTGLVLIEGYGMTEGGCVSSCNPLDGERRAGSIGFRLPYQEMKVVIVNGKGEYVRECKTDEIGAVVLRGPNIFGGYLPEEANEGIWPGDGWFNTGDTGREDAQGYFWLTGRTKELIIRGGHNIDPAVIENALIRHEAVHSVAAVGKPDSYAGEVPVAYVVLDGGKECDPSDLIEFARHHITERAAVPKEIYLIETLPVTAVGKIFKPELKRDAIKRAMMDALADFDLTLNISVEADKTYGTVAIISNVPEKMTRNIRRIMGRYAFRVEIIKQTIGI